MFNRTLSIALLLVSAISFNSNAQQRETVRKDINNARNETTCAHAYLGLSTGFNNHSGLIGFNIDVPVAPQFSVGAGAGLSTWGTKVYGEGRFYFKPNCHRGWAIGAGVTHSTGLDDFEIELEDRFGGKVNAVMDLKSKTNANFSGYYFFSLGRQKVNRFHLQAGYSIPLSGTQYVVKNGVNNISKESDQAIRLISPGGLIFGLGFTFRIF